MNAKTGSLEDLSLRRSLPTAGAVLLFGALTLLLLGVRPSFLGSRLPADLGDPVLNLYFLDWGAREVAHGFAGFWDANFYFPATGVMTFADHLIGPAIQAALFRQFWDNDVAAYNFLFLGSFVLSGLTAAWVLRQAGASRAAAVIAGLIFAFSPYRSDQRSHLPVLLAQWIPLVLWHWDRLLASPSWWPAAGFTTAYVLHVSGGTYLAYFVHLALVISLVLHWRDWRTWWSPRSLAVLVPVAAICIVVALALFLPYLRIHEALGLERTETEIRAYGADFDSWLSIEGRNQIWGQVLARFGSHENHLFAGAVATLLAAGGAFAAVHDRRRRQRDVPASPASRFDRNVIVVGVFFVLLGFTAIYLPLSRVVPGLAQMRVPTRVYPFVSFMLALLAARAVDRLLALAPPARRALLAAAIAIALLFELRTVMHWKRWPPPKMELGIFREIARRDDVRAVLHLPLQQGPHEAHYMYFSTLHWKPIANGYSGYAPATYRELAQRVPDRLFEEETIDYLLELGVTHVATHAVKAEAPDPQLAMWSQRFARGPAPRLRRVASAGDDHLYQLMPR